MGRRKKCSNKVLDKLEEIFQSSGSLESCLRSSQRNPLSEYVLSYNISREHIMDVMYKAILEFSNQPLFTAYLSWVELLDSLNADYCKNAYLLVKEKILNFTDENDNLLTIGSVKYFDHKQIINTIRCRRDFSLELREELVSIYLSFTGWLEVETHDYVSRAFDPDELKRQGKAIHYSMFIKLLNHLDEKMQLIAKLLYFGGSRTLDEVLSLDIKDVNIDEGVIRYKSSLISYPEHVLEDIKALMQERANTKGRIFLGRQNANLNPATVFRNFKEAASRVGLGDSFTHKSLTTSL